MPRWVPDHLMPSEWKLCRRDRESLLRLYVYEFPSNSVWMSGSPNSDLQPAQPHC
jgi:hypothetical protein